VIELRCTYDPLTKGGNAPDGRKVKGTIHWVSAAHAINAEVRLYDHLLRIEDPADVPENEDSKTYLNEKSLEAVANAKLEPSLKEAKPGEPVQFERLGYFVADSKDSQPAKPVFNRSVTLKDAWAKIQQKG
jgi:glutaminyl-tRNA synthetase